LSATAPDAPCPTCPEWTAADLLWHLTEVHHFWADVLAQAAQTDMDVEAMVRARHVRSTAVAELLVLREQATDALLEQLDKLDDAEPRWSWWEADQTVGFTRRMQTFEATMHRVDAELTAGLPIGPIDAEVAAGAVDQVVDVMWGWLPEGATYEPLAVVEFIASDLDHRWLVEVGHWLGGGSNTPRAVRAAAGQPTATVTAPALDLALWAWTRGGSVHVTGQPEALAALDAVVAYGIP
jgi:uncharacterized protein (TIGR03083 family)